MLVVEAEVQRNVQFLEDAVQLASHDAGHVRIEHVGTAGRDDAGVVVREEAVRDQEIEELLHLLVVRIQGAFDEPFRSRIQFGDFDVELDLGIPQLVGDADQAVDRTAAAALRGGGGGKEVGDVGLGGIDAGHVQGGFHDIAPESDAAAVLDAEVTVDDAEGGEMEVSLAQRIVSIDGEQVLALADPEVDESVALAAERVLPDVDVGGNGRRGRHLDADVQVGSGFLLDHAFGLHHGLVGVFLHRYHRLREDKQVSRRLGTARTQGDVEASGLGRPGVHVQADGVEGTGDIHFAGAVHGSRNGGVPPGGNAQHLHLIEPDMRVQTHVLEPAEQEAARDLSLTAHAVRQGHLGEVEAFRIHGKRSGNAVGDLREIDSQPAVHELGPLAGNLEFVQGASHVDLAVQPTAEFVEDPFEDRGRIADIQAGKGGIGLDGLVVGVHKTGQVDVPCPVQAVPDADVEAVLLLVPQAHDLQPAHRPSGDVGGIAVDARQQADRGFGRGNQACATGCVPLEAHLSIHEESVQQRDVKPFQPNRERVCPGGGQATLGKQFLRSVGDPQPVHPDVSGMDRDLIAVNIPLVTIVVDAGRKGFGRDGQFLVLAVQQPFQPDVALAQGPVSVVEDEIRPEPVVVGGEFQDVVPGFEIAGLDGAAGDVRMQGAVQVVQVQPEIFHELVLQGQPAGGDVSGNPAVPVHAEREGRVLLDVHAGNEESQQGLAVVEFEIDLVGGRIPGPGRIGKQGGKLFPHQEFLEVVHQIDGGFLSDESSVGKRRIEADPVDVVVGVGAGRNVADVMPAGGVLQDEVPEVHFAQQILVLGPDEIGIGLEGDLGRPPLVQLEGIEVGVTDIGVELIGGIAGFRREVELALEEEIQVGVVADDAPVERLSGVGSRRPDARIVIAEGLETGDFQGVDPDLGIALGQDGFQGGFQGDGAEGFHPGDPACIQVPGPRRPADRDGMFAVHQVPQHQVHIGRTGGGIQATLYGQAVQGTLGRGVQKEFRSFADLRKVQFRLGRPFADKSRQSVRRETEVLHVEVHPGGFNLGKAGHGSVRAAGNAAAKLLEGKTPDLEMVHRAFHPARNIGFEGKVVQLRGEMADCLHGEDRRSAELTLHPDLFEEAAVVVDGGQEPEILQVQVRIVVLDVQVVQKDLFMTHFHLSGDIPDVPSRLVGYPDVVRDAGDFPVLDEQVGGGHIGQDLQVVPVDDAVRSGLPAFLSPPDGGRMVHEPEAESFHLHPAGFQEVAEFLLRFSGRLQSQDAEEVAPGLFPGRAGLHHIVEGTVLQTEPAHGNPFLMQESLEGEAGR